MLREERRATIGLGLAIALLALVTGTSAYALFRHRTAVDKVQQRNDALLALEAVLSAVKDGETGVRGYLVTGQAAYLAPYEEAVRKLPRMLADAASLVNNEPEQQGLARRLRELAESKLGHLKRVMDARSLGNTNHLQEIINENHGKIVMDDLRAMTALMQANERAAAREARSVADGSASRTAALVIGGSTLLFLCLGLATRTIMSDMRRRREAERSLAAMAEERALTANVLDSLLASAPIGFAFFDREHRYVRINDWLAMINGIPAEDHLGRPIADVLPVTARAVDPILDRVMRTGAGVLNLEVTGETPAQPGRQRHWLTSFYPVRTAGGMGRGGGDGDLVGVVVLEITERRLAEDALRESRQRLDLVIDAIGLGMWYCDLPEEKLSCNERMREHLGLDEAAEPTLTTFLERIHEEEREQVALAVRASLDTGAPFDADCRVVGNNGPVRWIRAIGRVLRDPAGAASSFDGVTMDITERMRAVSERAELLEREREARNEAERTSRVKDEFVATLSHELRTPLNAILGWARMLREKPDDREGAARGLEVIERNARVQAQLIDDLLDISRIVSGKLRLDVQRVDLAAVIGNALETVRPAAEAKGISLVRMLEPTAPPVHGDPGRLQQVVWNLLSNAIKFTPRGGRVQILLRRVESHVEIVVTDNGAGIPPEFLPHVFERFSQADPTATRKFGGLGLGLSIVRHLVELHGGSVRVESDGPGRGAVFTVALPVLALQPHDAISGRGGPADPDPPAGQAPLGGVVVLVVDDEADAREMVQRVLEGRGASVLTAASAAEALQRLDQQRPDVVVSDIGMPDVDGYELLRRIRSRPPAEGGNVPAAALTAFARSEDRTRAMLAGYQTHLTKPVEPAELIATVATLVGRTGNWAT